MKKNLLTILAISAMVFLISATALFAQDERTVSASASKYVISAEAGGVNYVQGRVVVMPKTGRSGHLLKGDTVKVGDRIMTSEDGKAEILLNPGSYIRLGGNSSFEFTDTSLENLQLKLYNGSAMFEVITSDDFTFAVNTPKASFNIVKSGIYRIDVLTDGTGKIEVRKGQALIGDDEDAKIKKGKTATVDRDDVAVAKFDRGERDDLENWSRDRAKELDKINDRLERDSLRNTLINGFGANSWNLYNSFGLWVYDPFWGSYCFLPFGYGWSSPYGYTFGRDIWWFKLPRYIYTQQPPRNPTGPVNSPNPNGKTREDRRIIPPFEKIDRASRGGRLPTGGGNPNNVDMFPTRTTPGINPSQTAPSETRKPSQPPLSGGTKGRGDN